MDHVLLYGPPGLGKTTLAGIIAAELGVGWQQTSGPVLQKKLDLVGILSNIQEREVFFIDEIHRLQPDVEEMIYSALEDFRMDILIGTGPGARTVAMDIKRFTAIGATTRQGLISAPLRSRFGLVLRLNPYDQQELRSIVIRSAQLLDVQIDNEGAEEVARRSRGTPRIANRLLRRVRDYAQVRAGGHVDLEVARRALDLLEVDRFGLDEIDQKIMLTILEKYGGGPVGLATIAASIDEEPDTIEEVYEPYLMQLGFLDRTPRGRCATDRAFEYFKVAAPRAWNSEFAVLKTVYLGLGSNLGDRLENLASRPRAASSARICSSRAHPRSMKPSRAIFSDQPWFLNQVIEARTTLFPRQLLARAQKIEREMGRTRTVAKGPRPIDIDILLFGDSVVRTAGTRSPAPTHGWSAVSCSNRWPSSYPSFAIRQPNRPSASCSPASRTSRSGVCTKDLDRISTTLLFPGKPREWHDDSNKLFVTPKRPAPSDASRFPF